MNKFTLLLLAACLAGGTVAVADEMGSRDGSQERFRSLDKDNNGYISHDEAKDKHRVFWYYQRADRNSDGGVDQAEFSAFESEFPDTGSRPAQ